MSEQLYLFLAIWLLVVPPASALVAHDIVDEKIFAWLTAWIDRRHRGTPLAYLFRCEPCLSHWAVFIWAALFGPAWWLLPFSGPVWVAVVAALILAAVRITTRFWTS